MVYVNSDGTVSNQRSFGLNTITNFFLGILSFFYMLIYTLFNPGHSSRNGNSIDYRPPGSGYRSADNFRSFRPSGGSAPDAPSCSGCGCG